MQYLLGFRRLGWDVLFLDHLESEMLSDQSRRVEESGNVRYLVEVMQRFGLDESFALFYDRGRQSVGLDRDEVRRRLRDSALLLNVMGFLDDPELLDGVGNRVFLDIDPGFGQMWRELALADVFGGHDAFVTVGNNIGHPECTVPTCGLDWITTSQPVVLDQWRVAAATDRGFTSVVSWRGAFGPIDYRGDRYGLRVHEFRRFIELPLRSGRTFELALDIHPDERADLAMLNEHGWRLVDPRRVAGSPDAYRRYVQGSRAEFMVAKNIYVKTRSGWFSDRSICYLASGKPVLAQDTGLDAIYPVGEGLITFNDADDAVAGVEEIERDYARHAHAARALAEEYFDSDVVLPRLLTSLGVA